MRKDFRPTIPPLSYTGAGVHHGGNSRFAAQRHHGLLNMAALRGDHRFRLLAPQDGLGDLRRIGLARRKKHGFHPVAPLRSEFGGARARLIVASARSRKTCRRTSLGPGQKGDVAPHFKLEALRFSQKDPPRTINF